MSHCLVEIPSSQWSKLRDLYVKAQERSASYNLLQNFIDWEKKCHQEDVKIYSLDGDWEEDGTFVAMDRDYVYINTLAEDPHRLKTALSCLDTVKTYFFAGVHSRLYPLVEQHLKEVGSDVPPFAIIWHHISRDKVLKFSTDAPEGITLGPVEERHAVKVDGYWPHTEPGTVDMVRRLIRLNDSVAAYNEKGEMIAWCLTLTQGALGILHVEEAYRRKGLGQLMVRCLAKIKASKGLEVIAPVNSTNPPSLSMFKKMGFTIVDTVYWVARIPKIIK